MCKCIGNGIFFVFVGISFDGVNYCVDVGCSCMIVWQVDGQFGVQDYFVGVQLMGDDFYFVCFVY